MRLVLRVLTAALIVATAVGCTVSNRPRGGSGDGLPRPRTMAALGDSITRGFAACGRSGDCPEGSWATGDAEDLDSHGQRLGIDDHESSRNLAVSGARVAGLASQVRIAVAKRPDYVTVLIGANDVCAADEVSMTSVEEYSAAFHAAMDELVQGLPDGRILVLSVPDLSRLWEIGKDRAEVRGGWESHGVCQSMLANPRDVSAGADARRGRVRARIQAYNAAMGAACARHAPLCRYDQDAVFNYRFDLEDVSPIDYWHPSKRGQAALAQLGWEAGFWP